MSCVRFMLLMPWGRVGSNLLMHILEQSARIKSANESLNALLTSEEQEAWFTTFYEVGTDTPSRPFIGSKQNMFSIRDDTRFADLLRANHVRVVRLRRDNVIKTAVSQIRAEQYAKKTERETGVARWGVRRGERPLEATTIDPDLLVKRAEIIMNHQHRLMALFRPAEVLDVEYEELMNSLATVADRVRAYLDIPQKKFAPKFEKATPDDLTAAIANFDEIEARLAGTPFAGLMPVKRLAPLHRSRARTPLAESFPDVPSDQLFAPPSAWPKLDGCFGVLCSSRSGSTVFCRGLEQRFAVGEVGESLNPPQLQARARRAGVRLPGEAMAYTIEHLMEEGWYGFKGAVEMLISAERIGFIDHYLDRMSFILLLRRDLVAQAVSLVKAKITSRYHSTQIEQKPATDADYSAGEIAKRIRQISQATMTLSDYVSAAGRPARVAFYEDFANGDVSAVVAIGQELGFPARAAPKINPSRVVQRIGDEINIRWCERFRSKLTDESRAILDDYQRRIGTLGFGNGSSLRLRHGSRG